MKGYGFKADSNFKHNSSAPEIEADTHHINKTKFVLIH